MSGDDVSTPDVLGFCAALGLDVPDRAGNVPLRCPLPDHEDRNASASLDTDTAAWYCHACVQGGGPYDAAVALGFDRRDAVATCKRFGLWEEREPDLPGAHNGKPRAGHRQGQQPVPPPSEEKLRAWHERLLASDAILDRLTELRGWSRRTLEHFGLGFDGQRIVIPIRDAEGRVATMLRYKPGRRATGETKMLAPAGHARELFPAPETVEGETLWLVEGEPDAIAAHELGVPAVAIPGATAKGRKGTSWGRIRQLMALADPGWTGQRVICGLASGEGLIYQVRDPETKTVAIKEGKPPRPTGDHEEEVVDAGVQDKRLLVMEGEFARVLKVMQRAATRSLRSSATCGTRAPPGP